MLYLVRSENNLDQMILFHMHDSELDCLDLLSSCEMHTLVTAGLGALPVLDPTVVSRAALSEETFIKPPDQMILTIFLCSSVVL